MCVAGIEFGTTYSGIAFSWKSDWMNVHTVPLNADHFSSSKCPSVLLLNPDKSFLAFGYGAQRVFMDLREDSYSDSDSSDSNSQEETVYKGNEDWRNYYFLDLKKMLPNKNVSCLMLSDASTFFPSFCYRCGVLVVKRSLRMWEIGVRQR